jgi:hypothetical protein
MTGELFFGLPIMIFRCRPAFFAHVSATINHFNHLEHKEINLFTMEEQKKKSEVSPATTLPWLYSRCSDDNADEENEKTTTPARTQNVPKEITAGKFNTTGKKYSLADNDDVSDIDVVGIAHQIESQERSSNTALRARSQFHRDLRRRVGSACVETANSALPMSSSAPRFRGFSNSESASRARSPMIVTSSFVNDSEEMRFNNCNSGSFCSSSSSSNKQISAI